MKKVILLGAGGHCKVIIDILKQNDKVDIVGLIDKDERELGNQVLDTPIIGTDDNLMEIFKEDRAKYALVAIGSTGDDRLREKIYYKIKNLGYHLINAVHPKSIIGEGVDLGFGNAIMANAILNPGVKLGVNNIINSGAIIEHDVKIGDHIHIGPGVKLSGGIEIGDYTHVGTGAVVIQGVKIGKNCLIGAGAVIINDIPDNSVVVGNPGGIIRQRGEIND